MHAADPGDQHLPAPTIARAGRRRRLPSPRDTGPCVGFSAAPPGSFVPATPRGRLDVENLAILDRMDETTHGRPSLGEFLSTRRAQLKPADVGLPDYGDRRRVPGLRRAELAQLAGASVE